MNGFIILIRTFYCFLYTEIPMVGYLALKLEVCHFLFSQPLTKRVYKPRSMLSTVGNRVSFHKFP